MSEILEQTSLETNSAIKEIKRILNEPLPSRSLFEQYRPKKEWYLREWAMDGLHGVNHEARVMVMQEILSRLLAKTEGLEMDQEALRWAAVTHDVRRVDDDYDTQHGKRSAEWVLQTLSHLVPSSRLKVVAYINRWHATWDNGIPEMTTELAIFKDADALDRARLGDLKPGLLRHELSRMLLVSPADDLYQTSSRQQWRENGKLFDCVLDSAVEIGLLSK